MMCIERRGLGLEQQAHALDPAQIALSTYVVSAMHAALASASPAAWLPSWTSPPVPPSPAPLAAIQVDVLEQLLIEGYAANCGLPKSAMHA